MPEETTTIEAPAAPAVEAPQLTGMDRFMADVTSAIETPEPPKGDTAPAGDKPPVAPKPEAAKPAVSKPTDKPLEKPAATPKEDGGTLRRKLEDALKSEKTRLSEIETLKKQNEELSKKRHITPEMESEIEENKKAIAEYRKQIAEVSYERSAEFKKQFKDPWENTLKDTIRVVTQLNITNDEGESRKATDADFAKVANAHISERATIAQQLFGPNALLVLNRIDRLESITEASTQAIREHRDQYEVKQKDEQTKWQSEQKAYLEHRDHSRQELVEKYPKFFAEDPEDVEGSEALKKGFEFVDDALTRAESMSTEERAAHSEVVRARAGWFLRGHRQITKLSKENESLKAELAKYRASEPGGGEQGDARGEKPAATDDIPLGTEGLAERMERAARGQ